MGAFSFTNLQVRGASTKAISDALPKLTNARAYVSPPANGWVTIYAEALEDLREEVICNMAAGLSQTLTTEVLCILLYDNEIARYWLYRGGERLDYFVAAPDYRAEVDDETRARARGDTDTLLPLCLPGTTRAQLDEILHPEEGHLAVYIWEVIGDLAKLLGIDLERARLGFTNFDRIGPIILSDVAEFEPVGRGAARKAPQPQPANQSAAQPKHPPRDTYADVIHFLTEIWSDRYKGPLVYLTKMSGKSREEVIEEHRLEFEKYALRCWKRSTIADRPSFEELKTARDHGPDALAALIAARRPEKLPEIGVISTYHGLESFVAALLKCGLNPTIPGLNGQSTLDAAAMKGRDSAIYRLVKTAAEG